MPVGAPDFYKATILYSQDEDGTLRPVLVDKEGRIIFRSVTQYEATCQGVNLNVDVGNVNVNTDLVPEGVRWIVSSIACHNANSMNSSVRIWVHDGLGLKLLKSQNSPAPLESTDWQGSLVMGPGWHIRFSFDDCSQDDTLYWAVIYTVVED